MGCTLIQITHGICKLHSLVIWSNYILCSMHHSTIYQYHKTYFTMYKLQSKHFETFSDTKILVQIKSVHTCYYEYL